MTGTRRARPPFTLLSRANVIWGLASYILVGLGVIAEIIASAHALPLWVGISLVLAGTISLGVRSIALITTALLTRRSGRRLVETLLNANCTFWPFRLGGSLRAFRARSLSGPGPCHQARRVGIRTQGQRRAVWMQTTGTPLLAIELRRLARALTTAQDSRCVPRLLYLAAVRDDSRQQEHCQARLDSGLSAWELACHAFPTTVFAVQGPLGLPVDDRHRPSQAVSSGTQRTRRSASLSRQSGPR